MFDCYFPVKHFKYKGKEVNCSIQMRKLKLTHLPHYNNKMRNNSLDEYHLNTRII